jgi:hypothetical protein
MHQVPHHARRMPPPSQMMRMPANPESTKLMQMWRFCAEGKCRQPSEEQSNWWSSRAEIGAGNSAQDQAAQRPPASSSLRCSPFSFPPPRGSPLGPHPPSPLVAHEAPCHPSLILRRIPWVSFTTQSSHCLLPAQTIPTQFASIPGSCFIHIT